MPNTGKPSKDCHLCRSRRVKCDLGRPACQRCIKYGAECPGYRNEQELMFHNYNSNPASSRKRKKRVRQTGESVSLLPAASPFSSSSSSSSSSADSGPATPSTFLRDEFGDAGVTNDDEQNSHNASGIIVPVRNQHHLVQTPVIRSLTEHWTNRSVPLLLDVYSSIGFLTDLYHKNPADGPLIWAAHLFSRTYVINVQHPTSMYRDSRPEVDSEMGMYLGKTLTAISSALATPQGAMRDDVLATVWILANYELLVGSLSGSTRMMSPWHLHTRGLCSILKTRGSKMLISDTARVTFWSAYNMVQIEALVTSSECPPESEEWLDIIRRDNHDDEHTTLLACTFNLQVARIQCRMLCILRQNDYRLATSEYDNLVGGLLEAEAVLNDGFERNPCPQKMDVYWRQLANAAQVKAYHIAHLFINFLTHYPACSISMKQLETHRNYCIQRSRAAAQEILDHVSRYLGRTLLNQTNKSPHLLFDALKIIWPLTVIFIIPSTLPEHKSIAHGWLLLVGKELGIKQALREYPEPVTLGIPEEARTPLGIEDQEQGVPWPSQAPM